jgi:hypothetical protein
MLQKYYKSGIIYIYKWKNLQERVRKMIIFNCMYILLLLIFALVAYAILQIKLIGINVKDFWGFIEANQILDKLYRFAKYYEKMSTQQQILYLSEAEKVFDAFDKIPNVLWEDEYEKYSKVLEKYKEIKVLRWATN